MSSNTPEKPISDSDPDPENPESEPESESNSPSDSSSSDSDSDSSDYESDYEPISYVRPDGTTRQIQPYDSDAENTPEVNIPRFDKILSSRRLRKEEEEEDKYAEYIDDKFDFPKDPENWKEEDLKELWADPPLGVTKPGWDPHLVDEEDIEIANEEIKAGRDPPIAPFYVPYRKSYPVIPDNHHDISDPKSVIEELDRTEEFLVWVSYIFEDGSSYEGTVWDDLAHGKGVYVAEQGLVRYEGEWLQNNMEGHGVVEVDIPHMQPIPGSKLEAQMRAEGQIITRDFMSPEDREWLEKDIEDSVLLADGEYEIPFYENDEWIRQFGEKPEKGRYRYAGQWKHGRMHGCGVYEVNERTTWGRFYFGNLLEDTAGCDADVSGLHAGIAEVAAAKARMFVNKPNGMIREARGPYSDPQHPYLYEEEDVWMAPGFINQFYEVPDYWKAYVRDVDEEREMWLNSFYKAPLRLPMTSELQYWWENDQKPEFVLINKEPEPDPTDPSKLIYTEDPLILHTPTGRIIDYVDDEEHGIRLFWQPPINEGESVNSQEPEFLPLGFDEFYGEVEEEDKKDLLSKVLSSVGNVCRPAVEKLGKWAEEHKKANEVKLEILQKELELAEAEIQLKETMDDLDEELKMLQIEEEKKEEEEIGVEVEEEENVSKEKEEKGFPEGEFEEEEEEEDDDIAPSSFGSVGDQSSGNDDQKGKFGKSPFAACSLAFAGSNLVSLVPSKLQQSFSRYKQPKLEKKSPPAPIQLDQQFHQLPLSGQNWSNVSLRMRYVKPTHQVQSIFRIKSKRRTSQIAVKYHEPFNILSLHSPLPIK